MKHQMLRLSSIVQYACIFPWQGEWPCRLLYVRNTYVEAEGIRPFFLRMSSGVVRGRRGFMVTGSGFGNKGTHDWQPHHTSLSFLLSPLSQAIVSPPGPRIMSLGVLKAARTLIGFSTRTGLLTLTGKLLAARKRNPSAHAPHMGAGKLNLTPRT